MSWWRAPHDDDLHDAVVVQKFKVRVVEPRGVFDRVARVEVVVEEHDDGLLARRVADILKGARAGDRVLALREVQDDLPAVRLGFEYRVSLMPIFSNELRICSGVRPNSRSIATMASEL